jgi:hypothetical protein
MWPVVVNAKDEDFTGDSGFTLGAMADSVYEYLPKVPAVSTFSPKLTSNNIPSNTFS